MDIPFFAKLAIRLANGVGHLKTEDARKITRFFSDAQEMSGGFVGRKGKADIYYTSFALRGLALLGALENVQSDALGRFLENVLEQAKRQTLQSTELIAFLFCVHFWDLWTGETFLQSQLEPGDGDWRSWIFSQFSRFRCRDGGYASSDQTTYSSTYHTFLVCNVFENLFHDAVNVPGFTPIEPIQMFCEWKPLWEFLVKRQRRDGGFVELEPLRHSGTNPTVAGIGLLQFLRNRCTTVTQKKKTVLPDRDFLQQIDDALSAAFVYLKSQQAVEGGIRANNRVPIPDLLSTFTALSVLTDATAVNMASDIQEPDDFDLASVRCFVRSLRKETSQSIGYVGGLWDNEPDVEFTFYGLAAECLL